MTDTISTRVLNRTLLARQHLIERSTMTAFGMIDHLIGLQAQDVMPPFIALWSRLRDFEAEIVSEALDRRSLVRITLMRGMIHMISGTDALRMQPLFQGGLEKIPFRPGFFFGATIGMNADDVRARSDGLFAADPLKTSQIRDWAKLHWPERDSRAITQAIYYLLPLLQVPPRGKWKRNNRPQWTTVENWLGSPLDDTYSIDHLVTRYLRAFGPASTMDMHTWSKLTGFKDAVERLGNQLRTYKDERGRTLYDVADGQLTRADVEAPIRFLGWFDNIALSHQDRSRIIGTGVGLANGAANISTLLIDGSIAGSYKILAHSGGALLHISPSRKLSPSERTQLLDEGERLLRFIHPELTHDSEFVAYSS